MTGIYWVVTFRTHLVNFGSLYRRISDLHVGGDGVVSPDTSNRGDCGDVIAGVAGQISLALY